MRPSSCRTWSCSWLRQVEFPADLRPDLAHVVFDPVPDVIYQVVASGERQGMECVQLWVDPFYPEAHRAPAVRDIIAGIAVNHHMPTLARIGPDRGLVILAPCLTSTAEWHEQESLFDAAAGGDPVARVNALRAAGEA